MQMTSCIDFHENSSPQDSTDVDSRDRNFSSTGENMTSSSCEEHGNICIGGLYPETPMRVDLLMSGADGRVVPSVEKEQVPELQSDGTPAKMISNGGESCTSDSISPATTTTSDLAEDEDYSEHQAEENGYTAAGEMDKEGLAVILSPDYVIYRKTSYGEAQLMLLSDSIVIKCLDTNGNNENFVLELEWAASEIIHTECQWSRAVDAALVKFHLRTTAVDRNENVQDTCDVVQLIIAVTDVYWLEKELKSKFLQERYKALLDVLHGDDLALEHCGVERNVFFPRYYFTEVADSFEDVIYPKGDPDAVSISRRDVELLQPDTFVNDTIIDFYIKHLKTKIAQKERERFHFFNSFFFRKLADLDKDPGSASEGRAAFLRVRKWTRKLNIFEKDYIFIPVNFNLHWSLLVICHPGEIAISKDDMKDSPKVPCILHMDSIKGNHSGLKNLVQSYLWEEWKERHPESSSNLSSVFSTLRFVSLELPQQENSFDCGLFLLHYVELFLEEAPVNFSPFHIKKFSSFLTVDWFIPSDASFKRSLIRKLIYDLLNASSQNVAPTFCGNEKLSLGYHENENDQKLAVEFLNQCFSPSKTAFDNRACSVGDSKSKTDCLAFYNVVADFEKQGEAMHKSVEPVAKSALSPEAPCQKLKCVASQTEEHADTSELYISSSLNKDNCQQVFESPTVQLCSTSHCPSGIGEYEIPINSFQHNNEVGADSLNKTVNYNNAAFDERTAVEGHQSLEDCDFVPGSQENCDNVPDSLEDCDNVPDGAVSSFTENHELITENQHQIDANKAEEGGCCQNSQAIEELIEPKTVDIKCEESNTAEVNADDSDKHQRSGRLEAEVDSSDELKKSKKIKDNEMNLIRSSSEIDIAIDADVTEEKDPCKLGIQTSTLSQDSRRSHSLRDTKIPDDEPSLAKDDGRLKRGEPSTRIELHYQKRRKLLPPPEIERRLTRSVSRGRPS